MTKNKYYIFALVGKSGSGKSYILNKMYSNPLAKYVKIISTTTRPPREGEVEGKDYYFVSEEEFKKKEYLECTQFRGWYYGTSIDSLDDYYTNIGVFNPAGIIALAKDPRVDLEVVEIAASDKTRLLRQLNRETNPDVKEIIRRYSTDEADFENKEFQKVKKELTDKGLWSIAFNEDKDKDD